MSLRAPRVNFYTTGARCIQCVMTHRLLDELGVSYDLVDVTEPRNAAALEYITDDLGYSQAPVLVVIDEPQNHWSGFDPERLKALAAATRAPRGRIERADAAPLSSPAVSGLTLAR